MKEITGNLWDQTWSDAICITTNGFIKKNGCCVMGRGCAKEATIRYKGIDKNLGTNISSFGNVVNRIGWHGSCDILSFPVKHNFWEKADMELIKESAKRLVTFSNLHGYCHVVIPRPGCGCGKLDWETEVKPILEPILDDRFYIITRERNGR